MNSISIASALHKMQIQSPSPWHILLTIIPDPTGHPDTILRLARENQDVVYQGNTYVAFNFNFDVIQDKTTGQLSSVSIQVCNINRAIHYYLEQYDGGIGAIVDLRVVSQEAMNDEPSVLMQFEIIEAEADSEWATFTLGADNPMRKVFPKFIYLKDYCIWKYNSPDLQVLSNTATSIINAVENLIFDTALSTETAHNTSSNSAYNKTNFPANFTGTTWTSPTGTTLAVDSTKYDDGFNPVTPAHVSNVSVKTLCPNFTGKWFAHLNPWFRPGGGGGHINIGVNSNSTAWVQAALTDIKGRGFDGVIIDWYGPATGSNPYVDQVTLKIQSRLGVTNDLTYSIQIDAQCYATTNDLKSHLSYIQSTYLSDPNYQTVGGKPIISFFNTVSGVDYAAAKSSIATSVYFMFENASSLANSYADACFDWIHAPSANPTTDPYYLAAVNNYLATVHSNAKGSMPALHPGFNGYLTGSTLWAKGKYMPRDNGKCWLSIAAAINANIPTHCIGIQVATWCDWEEGSEIEAGIENGITVNASVSATGMLSYFVSGGTGDESTISQFKILASRDGSALSTIATVAPSSGVHTYDLNVVPGWGFGLTYEIYVLAIGKASIRNHISAPAGFTAVQALSVTQAASSSAEGSQCGYVGPLQTCDKTLEGGNGCRAHNNSSRFGAFPFIDSTGFRAASIV